MGLKIEGDNIFIIKIISWQSLEKSNIREVKYIERYGMGGRIVTRGLIFSVYKGNLIKTYAVPMLAGEAEFYKRKIDRILHPEDEDKYKIKLG